MKLTTATPPVVEPISLAEAKLHLRVDVDADDTLITGLIAAAREKCEEESWHAFNTQMLDLWLDAWPSGNRIELPRPPLQTVTSIVWYDDNDVASTVNASSYYVDTAGAQIVLRSSSSWPTSTLRVASGIRVRFVAGFGSAAADVPARARQAIKLLVGHWYENREAVITGTIANELPMAVSSLLRGLRFEART